jgi:energy-coupling factor transporter ATP-binding protein EcfA2
MSDAAVEADGLRKSFGNVVALDGLSFAAQAGSVLGLLGPNGSGKTTTVSILSTSLRPDGGRAAVQGLDVVADAALVRRVIGAPGLLAALALVVVFAYAASWGFAALGLRVSDPEAAQAAGVPVVFLLVFTSAAFVPAVAMPGWLQAIGTHQPVNALVSAERALITGGPAASDVLVCLAWSTGMLLVFAVLAARAYARMSR